MQNGTRVLLVTMSHFKKSFVALFSAQNSRSDSRGLHQYSKRKDPMQQSEAHYHQEDDYHSYFDDLLSWERE